MMGMGDYVRQYLSGTYPFAFWFEAGQGGLGGTLWAEPDHYLAGSAVFNLDKVSTPTLFVAGESDQPTGSKEMYNGLERLGKPAALATYPNGGHVWYDWSSRQQLDFWNRTFAWFDEYLMPDKPNRLDPGAADLSMYYPDGSGRLIVNVPGVSAEVKALFQPSSVKVARNN
jgi:hypothetical protein